MTTYKRHHYIFPDGTQEIHSGTRDKCSVCITDMHVSKETPAGILGINHPNFVGRPAFDPLKMRIIKK
jgi:hypothetical protein